MAAVDQGKFACKQCGKTYKWKPDFAGRKVKCKCGYVMTAPNEPPGVSDEPDLDALYDLAEDGKAAAAAAPAMIRCPSCQANLELGTNVCSSCGFNLKTGSKAKAPKASPAGAGAAVAAPKKGGKLGAFEAYGSPRKGLQKDEVKDNMMLDYYVPIGLIVLGIVLSILQAMKFNVVVLTSTMDALQQVGLQLVISMALIATLFYFAMKWADVAFGSPGPAVLKVAGIVIAPVALANIVTYLIHDLWGMVGFFIAFGIFFTLFHYLFDMDMSEKWIVTGIACVVCMIATPFLIEVIQGGGIGKKKGVLNDDAFVQARIDFGRTKDAASWMDENKGRIIGDCGRDVSEKLIKDLYDCGAKEIQIQPEGPQAAEVMVKMPSDAKKRKAIIDCYNAFAQQQKLGPTKDSDGKWQLLRFISVPDPPGLEGL